MDSPILSLHHVTSTVAHAQPDVDFYVGLLGLRLVKKTVNFDSPGVYHLYYGNETGTPSTLMTTFPYAGRGVRPGTKGAGQITVTSFSVPTGSLEFWRGRLSERGVGFEEGTPRFGEGVLAFDDPSGLRIELLEGAGDERAPWVAPGVDRGAAVRGTHSLTLLVRSAERSLDFLTEVLGLEVVERGSRRTRVAAGRDAPGGYLDVVEAGADAPAAVNGLGTEHHVAMAVAGPDEQLDIRRELVRLGFSVTDVRDRQYFQSVYFREPGGILYEIATVGPGFLIDEEPSELGRALKLPTWEEPNRRAIESELPPLSHGVAE